MPFLQSNVRVNKIEQLNIDERPPWVPNEPFWCGICKRTVILKTNGECPRCHNPMVGPDEIPF